GPTLSTTSQNGPLRGYKMNTFEGGPRVPFAMQWKGVLPAGKTETRPVMNLDVLPTLVAAAGGKVDPAWKLDGVDLLPYLTGKSEARPHETMYWRFGPQWAVRHGDWKLVNSKGGSGKAELYDLSKDIGESQDMASAEPARVAELQKLYDAWSAEQAEPTAVDSPQKKANGKKKPGAQPAKRAAKRKAAAK
ncbi:MAG: sulfatase-like hydrolase/transferase, partial [Planctomycetales bacterium]|nr:sulfatase-like hydrolase/transferase [Planctomycetales bacterium]